MTHPGGRGLSFVIPAFNEERMLPRTLAAVRQYAPRDEPSEIIVVDNGSTDDTIAIAEREADLVARRPGVTIGTLRNVGIAAARFDTLIFIDADIELTSEWAASIGDALARLRSDPLTLTGSRCVPPPDGSWIERAWFESMSDGAEATYINSGHLIATRAAVDAVGGFDEALTTGEDFDFCVRARAAGASIRPDRRLRVVHHGFPKTIGDFFRREWWHGRGDVGSVRAFLASKVALASTVFLLLHLLAVVGVALGAVAVWLPALTAVVTMCLLFAVARRAPPSWGHLLRVTSLSYVYLFARALSPLHRFGRGDRWR